MLLPAPLVSDSALGISGVDHQLTHFAEGQPFQAASQSTAYAALQSLKTLWQVQLEGRFNRSMQKSAKSLQWSCGASDSRAENSPSRQAVPPVSSPRPARESAASAAPYNGISPRPQTEVPRCVPYGWSYWHGGGDRALNASGDAKYPPKNTICLWYDGGAVDAASFCA